MDEDTALDLIVKLVIIAVIVGAAWVSYSLGEYMGVNEATKLLQREAAREHAAKWVTGEGGQPEFKWLVCIPKEVK